MRSPRILAPYSPLIRGGQDSSQSPPCFRGMRGGSRYVQLQIKLV